MTERFVIHYTVVLTGPALAFVLVLTSWQSGSGSTSGEKTDAGIPGARSVKTVVDRADHNALYFQNSNLFPRHFDFVSGHLSDGGTVSNPHAILERSPRPGVRHKKCLISKCNVWRADGARKGGERR